MVILTGGRRIRPSLTAYSFAARGRLYNCRSIRRLRRSSRRAGAMTAMQV